VYQPDHLKIAILNEKKSSNKRLNDWLLNCISRVIYFLCIIARSDEFRWESSFADGLFLLPACPPWLRNPCFWPCLSPPIFPRIRVGGCVRGYRKDGCKRVYRCWGQKVDGKVKTEEEREPGKKAVVSRKWVHCVGWAGVWSSEWMIPSLRGKRAFRVGCSKASMRKNELWVRKSCGHESQWL